MKKVPCGRVLLLLAIYAAVVLPIIGRIRYVMGDEAAYIDPAIHFLDGHGFTSTLWPQSDQNFFACNVPLYEAALIPWLKLFGKSLEAGRSVSLLCFCAAIYLIAIASKRNGVLSSPAAQGIFASVAICGVYTTSVAQFIRPDALGLLILALAYFATTISHSKARFGTLVIAGAAAMTTGFQIAIAMAVLGVVGWAIGRFRQWRDVVAAAIGGLAGLGGLWILYSRFGMWQVFVENTIGITNRAAQWHGLRDPTLLACLLILGLIILTDRMQGRKASPVAVFRLASGLLVPLTLFGLSKFPQYYAHLATIPAVVCVSSVLLAAQLPKLVQIAAFSMLLAASFLGFPLRLAITWNNWERADPKRLEAVTSALRGAVFCDPGAYFAVKPAAEKTYGQFYLRGASLAEKQAMRTLIIFPSSNLSYLSLPVLTEELGGKWTKRAETDQPPQVPSKLVNYFARLSMQPAPQFERWEKVD